MNIPQPINPHDASEDIKVLYQDIQEVLDVQYVPLMFRYLAHYPDFLNNLWHSLKTNLEDPQFESLITSLKSNTNLAAESIIKASPLLKTTTQHLVPPIDQEKVLHEVEKYYDAQIRLAYISIAIRERTKGWAIGAKYLPSEPYRSSGVSSSSKTQEIHSELHESVIAEVATALAQKDDIRESLMKFIVYIHEEFTSIITQEQYVFTRVQSEKLFVDAVHNMPHPIYASYNEVSASIQDKRELGTLFYLLSEKFPVSHAVSSLMWSVSIGLLKVV